MTMPKQWSRTGMTPGRRRVVSRSPIMNPLLSVVVGRGACHAGARCTGCGRIMRVSLLSRRSSSTTRAKASLKGRSKVCDTVPIMAVVRVLDQWRRTGPMPDG